jgi:hypothetical protein
VTELLVELVPQSSWGSNLRKELPKKEWDRLRRAQYALAGHVCEVCGGKGRRHPVECHEIWSYNDDTHIQTLDGLIALCPRCHEVKHIGLAGVRGRILEAKRHLAKVNGWTLDQTIHHIAEAFALWNLRSRHPWTLDLSWLTRGSEESRGE